MKAHEYNPVHIHQGKLFTGLSSVMIMKLPTETGVEYSAPDKPMNGRLQIIGAANGQFSKTDYSPNMKIGDFYVFPYDMRHCVYPFNGTKEKRRTLVCNVDVDYNPVSSRTGREDKTNDTKNANMAILRCHNYKSYLYTRTM